MYAALWRILPGPAWVRVILLLVLAAAALYALITWAFPWAADTFLPQESTVEQ
ncbi:hypothetical protein EV141_1707 [Microcella putealis]|uniref:Phage shock protein C (PspC) family protein n=2 Tax=Microcella putealis TaxID=337005 RepID=A0A4Q7LPW7_9MICO|nr:hypothetical protein EV141_1707 [Microcella putealis]TQM27261.1 hypothetical protein BJ957_0694 [Microcella putealis]